MLPITVNQKLSLLRVMIAGSVLLMTGDRAFGVDFGAFFVPAPEVVFGGERLVTATFFFAIA
ncbi:MAG: hypothetical protein DWI01_00110 [Planctomycetota bacterium]|nr:MAG: hypothetical protein DWI01_00110 [Planctomycetota bacterium]